MSRTSPAGTPLGDEFHLYDTTLRDGAQREGISYSVADKLAVARLLETLGVGFIEGGWPGALPKDTEFFARAAAGELRLRHAALVAFGSTRRPNTSAAEDPQAVPIPVRKERNRVLRELAAAKNLQFRQRMVGRTLSAVTSSIGSNASPSLMTTSARSAALLVNVRRSTP